MERYWLLLIAVLIASGCVHSQSAENSSTDQTTNPVNDSSSDSNIVYYTSSGFQPPELTIERGETVTWINNASTQMWIASDQHPTHRDYSGTSLSEHCENGDQTSKAFDQCSSGDRFSFTFEKTGSWGYHNHKNAGDIGIITVE